MDFNLRISGHFKYLCGNIIDELLTANLLLFQVHTMVIYHFYFRRFFYFFDFKRDASCVLL